MESRESPSRFPFDDEQRQRIAAQTPRDSGLIDSLAHLVHECLALQNVEQTAPRPASRYYVESAYRHVPSIKETLEHQIMHAWAVIEDLRKGQQYIYPHLIEAAYQQARKTGGERLFSSALDDMEQLEAATQNYCGLLTKAWHLIEPGRKRNGMPLSSKILTFEVGKLFVARGCEIRDYADSPYSKVLTICLQAAGVIRQNDPDKGEPNIKRFRTWAVKTFQTCKDCNRERCFFSLPCWEIGFSVSDAVAQMNSGQRPKNLGTKRDQ